MRPDEPPEAELKRAVVSEVQERADPMRAAPRQCLPWADDRKRGILMTKGKRPPNDATRPQSRLAEKASGVHRVPKSYDSRRLSDERAIEAA